MIAVRFLVGFLGLVLTGSILWAIGASNFGAALGAIVAEPWGIVTLIDLYLGFIVASVVIGSVERSWRAVYWIVPVYFFGNIVTALWLVLRWRRVVEGLAR